jgi:hypothetical protein
MSDKNYKSYEFLGNQVIEHFTLEPDSPLDYDDVMKVYMCNNCLFRDGDVDGGREDCIDVGRESSNNIFRELRLNPNGSYVFTIKGGSHNNYFENIMLHGHGKVVDIEVGNWSTYNYDLSTNTLFDGIYALDERPITYCYRLGCKVRFAPNCKVKHLWWRSIGLTFYWWFKYVKHVIFKMHDSMGK